MSTFVLIIVKIKKMFVAMVDGEKLFDVDNKYSLGQTSQPPIYPTAKTGD